MFCGLKLNSVQDFLEGISLTRPVVFLSDDQIKRRFDEVCHEKILEMTKEKFRCKVCKKLFKGYEYVLKHLSRIHTTGILEEVREEFHQGIAKKNFLADSERPSAGALPTLS